jgi:hypothetical protein
MRRLTALLLIFTLPALAEAAGPLVPADNDNSTLDFSLRFARTKMPLDYAGRTNDTTSRWFGFSLREKAGKRVTLGMYGGYAWLTQTNNPVTAGASWTGFMRGSRCTGFCWKGGALPCTARSITATRRWITRTTPGRS